VGRRFLVKEVGEKNRKNERRIYPIQRRCGIEVTRFLRKNKVI
jgi:hypothetical protein